MFLALKHPKSILYLAFFVNYCHAPTNNYKAEYSVFFIFSRLVCFFEFIDFGKFSVTSSRIFPFRKIQCNSNANFPVSAILIYSKRELDCRSNPLFFSPKFCFWNALRSFLKSKIRQREQNPRLLRLQARR